MGVWLGAFLFIAQSASPA